MLWAFSAECFATYGMRLTFTAFEVASVLSSLSAGISKGMRHPTGLDLHLLGHLCLGIGLGVELHLLLLMVVVPALHMHGLREHSPPLI
jgi:hypothetical protein